MERPEAHIVHSPSDAITLRAALRDRYGVLCVDDQPDLGPLQDGRARGRFFRELWGVSASEGEPQREDLFAIWQEIARKLEAMSVKRLMIWTSRSGADFVFLRMVAHFLAGWRGDLRRVIVPPSHGMEGVALLAAEELLSAGQTSVAIDPNERAALATQFGAIAARPELLRLVDAEGNLNFHDLDFYDRSIVECCEPEWRNATYLVGMVMVQANGRNPVGDLLISVRLRHLINTGKIDARGNVAASIREFQVRRAGTGTPTAPAI